ncbi:dephospho-CoA kinase [Tissierellia bacterium KA00581]|nr:dephospho-CoA kinase [Tissierellia bacterium KA00581]
MKRNKIYIAITGQIASGKSSFSNLLKQRDENFLVLDADDQIKELYKRGAVLYDILVNEFGNNILNEKHNISKKKLREFVLLDDKNREKLNSLTHSVILKNMVNIAKNSDKKVVFFQIPLLNESIKYLEKLITLDEVWNIDASEDIRFKRLLQRKNITPDIARKLMSIQTEFEDENYDVLTVENNGSLDELDKKIDLFVENGILKDVVDESFFIRKKPNEEVYNFNEDKEENIENKDLEKQTPIINEPVLLTDEDLLNEEMLKDINKDKEKNDNLMCEKNEEEDLEQTKKVPMPSLDNDLEQTKVIDLKNVDFSAYSKNNSSENIKKDLNDFFNKENKDSFEDENKYLDKDDLKKHSFQVIQNISNDEDEEKENKKGRKKKKKMSILKKFVITIITIVVILLVLFFASIAYGGKNYSLNYLDEIEKYSQEYKVDPKVVISVMKVESDFNPSAQSHTNAKGLMQIMPDTSKHIAKLLKLNPNSIDLNDPETNIQLGTYYLKYLMNNFHNMDTVFAAYNAGFGNVNNWLKDEKYSSDGVSLKNIPAQETKNYVKKVNKAIKAYEVLYGEKLPTKKKKGFSKFLNNTKNTIAYLFRNF